MICTHVAHVHRRTVDAELLALLVLVERLLEESAGLEHAGEVERDLTVLGCERRRDTGNFCACSRQGICGEERTDTHRRWWRARSGLLMGETLYALARSGTENKGGSQWAVNETHWCGHPGWTAEG